MCICAKELIIHNTPNAHALPAHQKIDVIDNCIVFPADVVIDWNYISLEVRRYVVVVLDKHEYQPAELCCSCMVRISILGY